jgi:hypothetical protein
MFNNNINYNHREDKFHLKPYLFTIFCLLSSVFRPTQSKILLWIYKYILRIGHSAQK